MLAASCSETLIELDGRELLACFSIENALLYSIFFVHLAHQILDKKCHYVAREVALSGILSYYVFVS